MIEEKANIIKVIAIIDNDKSYTNEVDDSITLHQFKKLLAGAAHLIDANFEVYSGKQKYTQSSNEKPLYALFPNLNAIYLNIITNHDISACEDELISVNFNINAPCPIHPGKFKMLFCISCNKSICNECHNSSHKLHIIKEKADYLIPAKKLIKNIFDNSSVFKAETIPSNIMDCINYLSDLKNKIFPFIRTLIDALEVKIQSSLEYFCYKENEAKKNINDNIQLLEAFSTDSLIKLKNDINTNSILMDDNIFLAIYNKLEEIKTFKNEFFQENLAKYKELNLLFAPFTEQIRKITEDLRILCENSVKQDIYAKFQNSIDQKVVEKITKKKLKTLSLKE